MTNYTVIAIRLSTMMCMEFELLMHAAAKVLANITRLANGSLIRYVMCVFSMDNYNNIHYKDWCDPSFAESAHPELL